MADTQPSERWKPTYWTSCRSTRSQYCSVAAAACSTYSHPASSWTSCKSSTPQKQPTSATACATMDERVVVARDGVSLHVGGSGSGPDVVMLSGGPGCVQYLEQDRLVPAGMGA